MFQADMPHTAALRACSIRTANGFKLNQARNPSAGKQMQAIKDPRCQTQSTITAGPGTNFWDVVGQRLPIIATGKSPNSERNQHGRHQERGR